MDQELKDYTYIVKYYNLNCNITGRPHGSYSIGMYSTWYQLSYVNSIYWSDCYNESVDMTRLINNLYRAFTFLKLYPNVI